MSKEHLTYFKVENFKRFDSLELTDIGQFNLVVGDNNVGKTSVLEALLFEKDRIKCLSKFHKTLILKGIHLYPKLTFGSKGEISNVEYPSENFLSYLANDLTKPITIRGNWAESETFDSITFGTAKFEEWELHESPRFNNGYTRFLGKSPDDRYISFSETWGNVQEDDLGGQDHSEDIAGLYSHYLNQDPNEFALPLISVSLENNGALSKAYFEYANLSRQAKKQLIEDMRFLLVEIEDFEVRKIGGEDQLLVGIKAKDELMPISIFGESVTRALQILLEISKYRGKRLMIDEIDTGIHHSRMKNFLKTIFQVAEKNEVQLFMTTHSFECQQAFTEVFEEPDMIQHQVKARQFTLIEKSDGQVISSGRDFEQLQSALETGYDTRGGKRGW